MSSPAFSRSCRVLRCLAVLVGVVVAAHPLRAQSAVPVIPPPTLDIPRHDSDVTVDGKLDEPVWARAARLEGFRQFQPVDSRAAEDSTVVLVWYSATAIHFGILAYDRVPEGVRATVSDRDNIGNDDQVTLYLDTFNDRRRAYFFGVNPYGVQDDGVRSEGGFSTSTGMGGNIDRNPDFIWQSKGEKTAFGWQAEVRVPFKSLRWGAGDVLTWGLNVSRLTRRTGYEDTWTDVRRANASFLAQAGSITGIRNISRGVVLETQPTLTSNLPGTRAPSGEFSRDALTYDIGGNARLGFTQLTLDATINPDFSQVESDAGLVTINERFALFFPERRPFFLEGIELFASPNNLVYTRSVANPLAGSKLTGKLGAWTIAHLTALDEEGTAAGSGLSASRNAFVNLTRLRRDVGENSVAGVTLTSRDESGDFNRVLSVDTRLVFAKLYYLQAQLGASATRDARSAETRVDPLWEAELDRTGRRWGFNYKVTGIGNEFETWSGFVNRTGIVTASGFNRVSLYGARGAFVEQVTLFGGGRQFLAYGARDVLGSAPIEGSLEVNTSARVRGGWNVSTRGERGFVRFDPRSYAAYALGAPASSPQPFERAEGVFGAMIGSATVTTPTWRLWQGSVRVEQGTRAIFPEATEGRARGVTGSLSLRPTPAVRVFGTLTMQTLERRDGSEFARTILPRLKAEVQPNRWVFFRLVAEYRNERQAALRDARSGLPIFVNGAAVPARENNALRMDWLASYEPSPGTVAFLGYGSTLRAERAMAFEGLERVNDGFFVKFAYLFRR
jgi:hypothetical protein